jgi:protein ImuA
MSEMQERSVTSFKHPIHPSAYKKMLAHFSSPIFPENVSDKGKKKTAGFFNIPPIDDKLPNGELASGAIHEIIPKSPADFPAALGFLLCIQQQLDNKTSQSDHPVLWCHVDKHADFPASPYLHGLALFGLSPDKFFVVAAPEEKDMLWVLEEGLATTPPPLLIGANAGTEKIYDFTASRRLSLRAARTNGRLLLLRPHSAISPHSAGNTTAAATRWHIAAHPSRSVHYKNARVPAMGAACWQVSLIRCKGGKTGNWILEWDHETLSFNLASPLADRKPATRKKTSAEQGTFLSFSRPQNPLLRRQAGL